MLSTGSRDERNLVAIRDALGRKFNPKARYSLRPTPPDPAKGKVVGKLDLGTGVMFIVEKHSHGNP